MTSPAAEPPRALTFEEKVAGSSQVKRIRYLPDLEKLQVVFKSNPHFCYTYLAFPPAAWQAIQTADSVGSYLIKNVTRVRKGETTVPYAFAKSAISPHDDAAWAATTAGDEAPWESA